MIRKSYRRNHKKCCLETVIVVVLMVTEIVGCIPVSSTANPVQEAGGIQLTIPETITGPLDMALNPVESKLVFIGKASETDSNLYLLDIPSGSITTTLRPHTYYPISNPQWSPEGTKINFSGFSYQQNKDGIWIMPAGSAPVYVTSGNQATWSPDGTKLAVLELTTGNSQIKIVDLSDGTSQPIFASSPGAKQVISDLDWSPSSQSLAFTMTDEQNGYQVRRLYRIDQDGSNLDVLVSDQGGQSVSSPKWILNGKWVAFLQGYGVDQTLNFVRSDGQCVISPLKKWNKIISMDISRDGRTAIIQSDNSLYILDIASILSPQTFNTIFVCR